MRGSSDPADAGALMAARIMKDGVAFAQGSKFAAVANQEVVDLTVNDVASGSNVYKAQFFMDTFRHRHRIRERYPDLIYG
jgi:hypothetical protein